VGLNISRRPARLAQVADVLCGGRTRPPADRSPSYAQLPPARFGPTAARHRPRAGAQCRPAGCRPLGAATGRAVDCMGRQASDCVEREEKEALRGRPGIQGIPAGVLACLLSRAQGGALRARARPLPGAPGRNRCAQAAGPSRRHREPKGSPSRARKPAPAWVWDIACGLRGSVRAAGRRLRDLQAIRATVVRGSLPRHRLGARSALSQLQQRARFPAGRSARGDGGGGLSQGGRACCSPPALAPRQRVSRPGRGAARAAPPRY